MGARIFPMTLVVVLLVAFFSTPSPAAEGHSAGGGSSLAEFRLDRTQVSLALEPASFAPGTTPQAVLTLQDFMTNTPVLDADVYLLLESEGRQAAAAAHEMASPPGGDALAAGLDLGDGDPMEPGVDLSRFTKLLPRQMAGMFAAPYPLNEGDYRFTLAITSLDGRRFSEPRIYGGRLSYAAPSKALLYRMLFVMGSLAASAVVGLWLVAQRRSLGLAQGQKMNLLDIPWLGRFFRSKWFQPVFQIPTFAVFVIIILAGLFDVQAGDKNIATMLTWTIWWAGVIFTFVLIGRVWCMMCPFGAAQDWLGRICSRNEKFPKPLRNIWLSTILFLLLTWWDSVSGIVNRPALTAWLLIGFFAVSIATALVYRGRAFCRYICPIGGLIGIYSMFSPVELRSRCLEVCRKDTVKGCIRGTATSYPCPMFETPATMDRNNYCNLCSECIKSCAQDNIVLRTRSFAKDLWVAARGHMDEAYLVLVLVGLTVLMTAEMVEPWHLWQDAVIKAVPMASFGVVTHGGQEKFAFTLLFAVGALILPALLLFGTSLIVRRATGPDDRQPALKAIFVQFAYMFIPVGLSVHLAHNVSHLLREGQQAIPAIQRAANTYLGLDWGKPDWNLPPLVGLEAMFWLQMSILLIMNGFSLYAGYRIAVTHFGDRALKAFVPMAFLAVAFMLVNAYILGQPMSLRHTH